MSVQRDDGGVCFDNNEFFGNEGPSSQASLEDLCRSHLVSSNFSDLSQLVVIFHAGKN